MDKEYGIISVTCTPTDLILVIINKIIIMMSISKKQIGGMAFILCVPSPCTKSKFDFITTCMHTRSTQMLCNKIDK